MLVYVFERTCGTIFVVIVFRGCVEGRERRRRGEGGWNECACRWNRYYGSVALLWLQPTRDDRTYPPNEKAGKTLDSWKGSPTDVDAAPFSKYCSKLSKE